MGTVTIGQADTQLSRMWVKVICILVFVNMSVSQDVSTNRQKRLFFVSSSSTTSTLSTTTLYFVSSTSAVTTCGKRKRALGVHELGDLADIQIASSAVLRDGVDNDTEEEELLRSGQEDAASRDRDGRFLLYWMTTTSTSTTTSYTSTTTIGSLECTPSGFTVSLCG